MWSWFIQNNGGYEILSAVKNNEMYQYYPKKGKYNFHQVYREVRADVNVGFFRQPIPYPKVALPEYAVSLNNPGGLPPVPRQELTSQQKRLLLYIVFHQFQYDLHSKKQRREIDCDGIVPNFLVFSNPAYIFVLFCRQKMR